ncbi:MAG: NAD(P)-dependent oxidoreductase [Methylocystaceae bacterium]|nr:MAG: NAD(P)-dependent oxidoreductase [Methylocystaceae bacterium]
MRIFLTGATGFLGAQTLGLLVERGHRCAVLSRREDLASTRLASLSGRIRVAAGDMFDVESYRAALRDFAPEALVHCAWWGVAGADRNDIRQLDNIAATGRLASAAVESGARFLLGVGSQAEYGRRSGAMRETDAAEPTTLYGIAKLASGRALSNIAAERGVRAVWGRVFSLYGPGDDGPWLVPSLIRAFLANRAPELTSCEQIWEFTHVADAAAAIVALLESPAANGVFNIGSGEALRLRDAVLLLRDLAAPQIEPLFGRIAYRPDQVMRLQADISRIRDATGWRPNISLERGLEETIAWFRARAALRGGGASRVER